MAMRGLKSLAACLLAVAALSGSAQADGPWVFSASPDLIKSHMAYLASDELKGRDAGSAEYDLAADYVAKQFDEMGLKPLGDKGGFLQAVTLIRHRAVEEGTLRILGGRGGPVELAPWDDFRASSTPHGKDVSVTARAVFAGFGVVAPNIGRDDYAELDVKGKIVVVLDGAPPQVTAADRPFVASARNKALMAQKHGAVGLILISESPAGAKPTAVQRSPWAWTWETRDGDAAFGGVPVLATVRASAAAKLFQGAPQAFGAVLAASKAPQADPPRFNLQGRIEATAKGELSDRRPSSNVVALIEGSDPRLKGEYIVMSGHLDHVGVLSAPINGDAINNGALDNAGGIATLIEAGRGFASGPKPKRSIIFLAVTGEEKGLIGSDYFVRNTPVAKARIVGDVNLDMPVMTYDFTDVAAIGAEHSTIVQAVERAAARMNVKVSPDPIERLGVFTRSDHYRFVEQGIPAVFLVGGFENGGEKAFNDFYDNRYHKPGDDLNQAIDYTVGAKWARLNYEIARELADQPGRPLWLKNDLFGGRFAPREAIAP